MIPRLARILLRGSFALVLAAPVALVPLDEAAAQERPGARGAMERAERGRDRGAMSGRFGQPDERRRGFRGRGGDDGDRPGRGGRWGGGPGGMFGSMMRPGWQRRDLQLIDRALDLDADQESIAEVLMADYLDGFRAAAEEVRERMRASRPDMNVDEETRARFSEMREEAREIRRRMRDAEDGGLSAEERQRMSAELRGRIEEIREQARSMRPSEEERNEASLAMASILSEWNRTRRALDDAFEAELELILTDMQLERLPAALIDLRRARSLPLGRLGGESIDLTQLPREAGVEETVGPVMEPLIAEYERSLDEALRARDEHLEGMGIVMMDAFRTQDATLAIEATRTEARLREAVRDVNLRTHEMAVMLLGEAGVASDVVAEYDMSFRRQAFERAWGPTFASRSFRVAGEFEELTPEVAAMIAELQTAYEAEVAGLNRAIEVEIVATDGDRLTNRIERFAARMQGMDRDVPRADQPVRDLIERRRDLDRRFREQLESLLTPEQVERLPESREQRRARMQAERAERMRELIERFDRDGDGELTGEERRAAREAMRERFRERRGGGRDDD